MSTKPLVVIFGTCRVATCVDDRLEHSRLTDDCTFAECTKETIQLLHTIDGRLNPPWCIYKYPAIQNNHHYLFPAERYRADLYYADVVIVEVCTRKYYELAENGNIWATYRDVMRTKYADGVKRREQTLAEVAVDMETIDGLVSAAAPSAQLLFVAHYDMRPHAHLLSAAENSALQLRADLVDLVVQKGEELGRDVYRPRHSDLSAFNGDEYYSFNTAMRPTMARRLGDKVLEMVYRK